jgi:glyoxylase-like metal-dependent hydrolase (beta-lactamase superfamily II)
MPKINDHIFYYEGNHKIQRGSKGCRIYVIKGEKGTYFIDMSVTGKSINKITSELMVKDGIKFSEVLGFIITHVHLDHVRGAQFWLDKIGDNKPIHVHLNGVNYLKKAEAGKDSLIAAMGEYYWQITRIPNGLGNKALDWFWGKAISHKNVVGIEDGHIFDLGNVKIKAIFAPGHAEDHTAYEIIIDGDSKKYLVSGDFLSMKDIGIGNGLQGLASFNTPLSSWKNEMETLRKILNNPPDYLLTMHYGIFDSKDKIKLILNQALEEGQLIWDKTLEVLKKGPLKFRQLTKEVISFPKYLSGIDTRTCSMYVIVKEMLELGLIKELPEKRFTFALA